MFRNGDILDPRRVCTLPVIEARYGDIEWQVHLGL
jgi:hypothetical protein